MAGRRLPQRCTGCPRHFRATRGAPAPDSPAESKSPFWVHVNRLIRVTNNTFQAILQSISVHFTACKNTRTSVIVPTCKSTFDKFDQILSQFRLIYTRPDLLITASCRHRYGSACSVLKRAGWLWNDPCLAKTILILAAGIRRVAQHTARAAHVNALRPRVRSIWTAQKNDCDLNSEV